MRRLYISIILIISAITLKAQAPSGYYSSAEGLTGNDLKAALHSIIKDDSHVSYTPGLWNAYQTTDLQPGTNYIWDIYSDFNFTYSTNQCGSYQGEGDCYNREHLWAQSWTNNDTKEQTDLHHVYPTDGYVNQQRGNYSFGEVNNATWTSHNGGKLGSCKSSLGYTGTVFEPIDEYKGDIARALMYISVRYYTEDNSWSTSGMTDKSVIKDWAIAMLLDWHNNDPVSEKEINRNNAVYGIQGNRNPFVDNPDYARMIWDPTWSGSYQIAVAANPAVGGIASIIPNVNETVSVVFSEIYSTTTNLNGVDIALNDKVKVVFNKSNGSSDPTYYTGGTAVRAYGGNNFVVSTTTGSINKIVITYGDSDGSNTISTDVGSFSTNTWTGDDESVTFSIGGTSGNRRIKAIEVTYSHDGDPAQQATCANGSTATITATPNPGYHFVNWTKGGTEISTEATYSFTVSASGTYQANFEINTYNISVAANSSEYGIVYIGDAPIPSSVTVSKDFSAQGYSNEQNMNGAQIDFDTNVKVTFNKGSGNNPTYYNNGASIRVYSYNSFVVSVPSGTSITSIVLSYGTGDGGNTISTDVGAFDTDTWTGNEQSVTFSIGYLKSNHRRIHAMSVTYTTEGTTIVTNATFNYGETATITAVPNDSYSFVNWTKDNMDFSTNLSYSFTVTDDAELVANFINNNVATNTTVAALTLNGTVTVNAGVEFKVAGTITQPSGSSIVIENSAQLVNSTPNISATVKKNVTQWVTSPSINGWHAISTPVNDVNFNNVANLTSSAYNVYRLNEPNLLWENSQDVAGGHSFSTFEKGRGYLYRKGDNSQISYNGTLNYGTVTYPLTYTSAATKGFHLIGNPYPHNIYKGANAAIPNTYLEDGFYTLSSAGGWVVGYDHTTPIAPCQAILVQAKSSVTSNDLIMTNTAATGVSKDFNDNIMFAVSNSSYEDVAYAVFKDGHGLNKVEHRNEAIQKLYIQYNGEDFAIANIGEDAHAFNLNFHTPKTGIYTMKIKPSGYFSYLHLIDNITGEDIDLLLDDEYSFVSSKSDKENRFVVKFKYQSSSDSDDEIFVYQSGDEMVVDGVGELQIFDVMGRIVSKQYVNGMETIIKPSQNGVYIFRLIGESVKTQKIVVK